MKRLLLLLFTMLLSFNIAIGEELVIGKTKYKFEPGDKILLQYNFSKCPVGEIPEGFEKITGIGECVKYDNHIWVAPSTDRDFRLYKKLNLGRGEFSIEFDILAYQDISGLFGPSFSLRLLKSRGNAWDKATLPYDLSLDWRSKELCVRLEGVGEVLKLKGVHKKKIHIAVQVRRGQLRIYVNGKRAVSVLFNKLTPNEHISGVEFTFIGTTDAYGILLSNIKVAKYTKKEAKPTPEKLGIKVEKMKGGMKLTVPSHIFFEFNKFILKPEAKEALSVVADIIRENPSKTVIVTGYTDNIGNDEYNLKLSLQRAQSVADYLMYCEKINSNKFKIQGKGKANPIADNNTENGRAKNRRVEIELIE